jgi:hypothetical protein
MMGQGGPISSGGTNYGAAHARIDLDLSALTGAAQVARAAGDTTAKAIEQMFQTVQNEQKLALQQAKQATAAVQAQQAQITATTRAESAERIAAARTEASITQQQERAKTATIIEEQRRQTAAYKQEIKDRSRAQQQSQVGGSNFSQNAASFVGAAFGGPIGGLAGALASGNPGLAAGLAVNQFVSVNNDAVATATAYDRQRLAAEKLAGSQNTLNAELAAYDKATGGAIDQATKLADVTNLQAIGFAHNAEQVDRFTRAARGISIAKGSDLGGVVNELALGIANRSTRRFDQLGLGVDEVNKRIDELRKNNKGLTSDQAFQEAVLEVATEKYAGLTKAIEAQATGSEKAAKAVKDLKLAWGEFAQGPTGYFAANLAKEVEGLTEHLTELNQGVKDVQNSFKRGSGNGAQPQQQGDNWFTHNWLPDVDRFILGTAQYRYGVNPMKVAPQLYGPQFKDPVPSWMTGASTVPGAGGPFASTARFSGEGQMAAVTEWNSKRVAIENETQAAVASEARSWANQRLEAERSFTKTSVREAEDWSRQQTRTIEDFQDAQSKNARDFAKQQEREERDLGRSIAQAQADEADKIADIRKDNAKRVQEIEEDYADQRQKAARDHSDKLLDAAGNLNAKAIYQEQRNYGEQLQDAQKAHDKQVKDNKDQLQERLDDEAKSLSKSIVQQREALAQREADQQADYAQGNQDAQAQFAKEQARAADDRQVRIDRMAQDQKDQLDAIDRAHQDRLTQIADHADQERKVLKDQYDKIFDGLGIDIDGYADKVKKAQDDAIKAFDEFYGHATDVLTGKVKPGDRPTGIPATPSSPAGYADGGWVDRTQMALVHRGEFMVSRAMMAGTQPIPSSIQAATGRGGGNRSITFQAGSVVVNPAAGHDEERIADVVIGKINTLLEAA